ncbi:protein translocase subunit SecD [Pseudonocardia sp. TRM90224]|uniref:protein translocase subunit SecD n=1 Tax=Pseudonocardia sp. TRM90224 TaxID=2812678 RepID=UPI001E4F6F4F|nr:protein translocase subunit SecD [Pseudonocardia sp. TRM90224]
MATTPGQIRPWRYLASFLGVVAVLYALVFFTGDRQPAPKLGIDLQGGTRVTLEPRTETGAVPPREQLLLAQQIIQERVDGLGVGGAEVVLDGNNLTITVPGQDGERARSLGQTAQLRFREVIGGPIPFTPAPPAAPGTVQGDPAAPPAGGQAPPPSEQPAPPTGQPQGAADPAAPLVVQDVQPLSHAVPMQNPPPSGEQPPPTTAPPTPAPPASTAQAPADPRLAAAIAEARATRQSTDQATQIAAIQALDCSVQDPLRGYDDPELPLVACNQDGTEKYVLGPRFLDGTEIDTALAQQSQQGAGWEISLTFKSAGAAKWGEYTSQNVGKNAAFVLDGEVVSAPTIEGPIYGPTRISGQFNQTEAQQLAGVLRYGSLPLSFESSEAQTVSATLGIASLQAGLIAGGVGLVLVFIYCLIYYRLLGLLMILSLVLSGVIVFAVLVLLGRAIGLTLDLAGVAGFIVAIGITADSFVIFFERLKDEIRDGRSFRSAVPRGWVRARRTILAADAVSFLASAVLYFLAVGQVRGFAFTLGLSTVLDLVVVFLVTHPLAQIASTTRALNNPKLSGLGSVSKLGAERRKRTVSMSKGA